MRRNKLKRKIFVMTIIIVSLFIVMTGTQNVYALTPVEKNGKLQVIGNNLCDENANPIQLRGVGSHGLNHFGDCINDRSIESLVNHWGADILRVSISPYAYSTIYRDMIDRIVGECEKHGIYVIIDWHVLRKDGVSDGDPNSDIDEARAFFGHMSYHHGDKGIVLYELSNEPNHHVTWEDIKSYSEEMINEIRPNDPDGIIFVASPNFAQRPENITTPFTGEIAHNVMYTYHFYDEHSGRIAEIMQQAERIPLFVTEWGAYHSNGDPDSINYDNAEQWLKELELKKISWTHWAWCDGSFAGWPLQEGVCPDGDYTLKKGYGVKLKEWIGEDTPDPGFCFIATAAYGSSFVEDVETLRAFRDQHLLKNTIGRKFVEVYYKYSPPLAAYISDKPILRAAVREMLKALVWLIED